MKKSRKKVRPIKKYNTIKKVYCGSTEIGKQWCLYKYTIVP